MKKIVLAIALMFSAVYIFAQSSDETVIQLYSSQKQYEKAKDAVDKWLSSAKLKDKEKATALLWKLNVYSQIAADSSLSGKYPDAAGQAMDAFKQYQQIDPALKQLKEQNFAGGLGNLYSHDFDKGKNFFQAKQWDSSFKYFSQAQKLGQLLLANKLSSSTATVDTLTTLYSGYAAQNGKMYDSAMYYYNQLAALKIAGADYEDMYKFMVQYSSQQKDTASFAKNLALAKELYPNDASTWNDYEMSNMTSAANITELMQKYQTDAAGSSMTADKYAGYAAAFETNDSTQLTKLDSAQKIQLKIMAGQAYGKAYNMDSSNGTYAFGAGYYYFVVFETLDDRYHSYAGTSAALKTKREDIAKQQDAYSDSATMWLEKSFSNLSAKQNRERNETANLNRAVNDLGILYAWKRDRTKTNGKTQDYDKYDALYKKYDALYNTFK